jgi:O-antigen/teichoic acid export membrane protein
MPIKKLTNFIKDTVSDARKIITTREGIKSLYNVSLYRNAFYLLMTNLSIPATGFIFWIIAARVYSSEEVGIASALINAEGLLYMLCSLGFSSGLIRFLPQAGDRSNRMINTVFTVTVLTSIIASAVFIVGLGFWSPKLLFLQHSFAYILAFIVFCIVNTLETISDYPFIAYRRSGFTLAKGLTLGILRLPLVVVLVVVFGAAGIFISWGISVVVALVLGVFLLSKVQPGYRLTPTIDTGILRELTGYSLVNQFSGLLWSIPTSVLPLFVLNIIGAEANAYFYIAWSMGSVLAAVPTALSSSLFAEGSNAEEHVISNTLRTLKLAFLILVPAVILVEILADKLLLLFGGSYAQNGVTLVRILALSTLPLAVNYICMSTLRVQRKLRILFVLSASIAIATLAASYVLIRLMGINGSGLAWLGVQTIASVAIIIGFLVRQSSQTKTG